jgi:hypothetical protein
MAMEQKFKIKVVGNTHRKGESDEENELNEKFNDKNLD